MLLPCLLLDYLPADLLRGIETLYRSSEIGEQSFGVVVYSVAIRVREVLAGGGGGGGGGSGGEVGGTDGVKVSC